MIDVEPPQTRPKNWTLIRLRRHLTELIRLSGPIIISRMGILVMITADTVMVGHFSARELAYQSIGAAMIVPIILSFMGMILGTIVLSSNHFGAQAYEECGRVWRRAIPYAFVLGLIACLFSLFGQTWLSLAGQTTELAREGGKVMAATGVGLPAHLVFLASAFFLDGIRRPKPAMVLMVLGNLMNIFLNWVFVFGNLDMPADGAMGATWTTAAVRWFLAFAIYIYIWWMPGFEKYGIRTSPSGGWKSWADLRNLGFASGLGIGVESVAFATLAVFAGWLGEVPLATYAIGMNVIAVCFMIAIGLGSAAAVRVGIAYGRKDWPDMLLAGWTGLVVTTCVLGVIGAGLMSFPDGIAGFYSTEADIISATAPLIFFCGFILIFDGGQATMLNVLRGRRDVWFPSAIQSFSFLGVLVPLGYVFAVRWHLGAIGLFYGILIAGITSLTLLSLRFYWLGRQYHQG